MNTRNFILEKISSRMAFVPVCLSVLILGSCADDGDFSGVVDDGGDKGASVAFSVSNAQDDASPAAAPQYAAAPMSRAAFQSRLAVQGLTPEDLSTQKLAVSGGGAESDGLCIIETTTPGIYTARMASGPRRANVAKSITEPFSSLGYRGATSDGISSSPWFHNKETNADGRLVDDVRWKWDEPYARFYGISPQVGPSYARLSVSPASHGGTPYVDFEVEPDVKNQKDLMTACSGVVHYAERYVAPRALLRFRHALTAVRFKVGRNLSWNKTINKVEITGAMSRGRYTLPTDETGTGAGWSNLDAPATFTLKDISVSTSEAVNHLIMGNDGDNYTFYMLPQQLSGVQVKIYFSDGSTPIIANLSGQWKPGTTKTYALSQNTSTWQYQLTVTDPATAAYTATRADGYTVQSYRTDPSTGVQQPVAWKVVGYDADNDGTFSMSEKPAWLTSLSTPEGNGGTVAEKGSAALTTDIIDRLAPINKALREATPKGSAGSPYDLSTKGGSVARSTANSYVVSAPGHYRIPLVYGNAITDGATNTHSYISQAKTGTTNEPWVLRHFQDHAGQDITDPWITKTNGGVNAPDGARIVWADEAGLVRNLSVSGSGTDAYVNFEVPASAIKNGNAVVAVTKGGTVVWSWHLWFAPQDVLGTTEVTNYQGVRYNFSNQTLGYKHTEWKASAYTAPRSVRVKVEQTVTNEGEKQYGVFTVTQNNGSVRRGYSTLYQSGRKDAMPGTDNVAEGSFKISKEVMSIQNGIQHPETFYTSDQNNWTKNGYLWLNHWSMDNTRTSFHDDPVVKTIYDPSPAGFKMPAPNAFTGFSINGQRTANGGAPNVKGDWDNGYFFFNRISNPDAVVYMPVSGYRISGGGKLVNQNKSGIYWTAGPSKYLDFTEGWIIPDGTYSGAMALSVRSVSE